MMLRSPRSPLWVVALLAVFLSNGCAYQIIQSGKLNEGPLSILKERTAAARGLAFVRPLQFELIDEAQIRRVLADIFQRDFPAEKCRTWEHLFRRLGAIPQDCNLHDEILALLVDQASGFYDPLSKKLYISTKPAPVGPFVPMLEFLLQRDLVREFVLSHEMIHALQDQHFDLEKILTARKGAFDESLAVHSLVEGDALLGGLIAMTGDVHGMSAEKNLGEKIRKEAAGSSQALKKTPSVLREYLIFPYYAGLDFVQAYVRKNTWANIDSLYRALPVSSEQILHPEKYFAGEQPVAISMEKYRHALGDAWKILEEDTLGEAFLGVIFTPVAAAGWGGDRFLFAEEKDGKGEEVLIWETRWDTQADAEEFVQAISLWQEHREVQAVAANRQETIGRMGSVWEMTQHKGQIVRWIQAPSEAMARSLLSLGSD